MATTLGNAILVETTILVDFLRRSTAAAHYLDTARAHAKRVCSAVTKAELIVGQQISGEREQQGQDEQDYAHVPVELTRLFVRPSQENAEHVQPYRNHHQVRCPTMHVAQQFAEWDIVLEIQDVAECLNFAGMVIEHQQDAGKSKHDKKVKGDSAHAPGVAVTHGIAINFRRVKVKEYVGKHPQSPVARGVIVLMAEDGGINLSLGRVLETFDLLFGFRGQVGLEGLDIFLHARLYFLQQADSIAIFSVLIFFSHHILYTGK
jgi:predicted nucleic acid-binding protein